MVAQFSEIPATLKTYLIPNISINANIEDVGTSSLENGITVQRHGRIAQVDIDATGIKLDLISNTINRIFNYVTTTIVNDVNIPTIVGLPLNPCTQPTDKPKITIAIKIDHSEEEKTCNLSIKIANLQASFVDEVFARMKTYILDSIANDMNPNI